MEGIRAEGRKDHEDPMLIRLPYRADGNAQSRCQRMTAPGKTTR